MRTRRLLCRMTDAAPPFRAVAERPTDKPLALYERQPTRDVKAHKSVAPSHDVAVGRFDISSATVTPRGRFDEIAAASSPVDPDCDRRADKSDYCAASASDWLPERCSHGFSARSILCAVLTSAMWEKACGKLPSRRWASGSYSSDSRPTSLRNRNSRSNNFRASSGRPSKTYASANQKLHVKKTPSPGGRPSSDLAVSYLMTKPFRKSLRSIALTVPMTRAS